MCITDELEMYGPCSTRTASIHVTAQIWSLNNVKIAVSLVFFGVGMELVRYWKVSLPLLCLWAAVRVWKNTVSSFYVCRFCWPLSQHHTSLFSVPSSASVYRRPHASLQAQYDVSGASASSVQRAMATAVLRGRVEALAAPIVMGLCLPYIPVPCG